MIEKCEFILIVGFPRKIRRSNEFSDNVKASRFYAFKKRLCINKPIYFPGGLEKPNNSSSSKNLSAHLASVRLFDSKHYIAAGCSQEGHAAAIVDIKSMQVVRPVIETTNSIHNLIAYKGVVLYANDSGSLYVTGLDTQKKHQYMLPDIKLNSLTNGSKGLNCGRHMLLDGHMVYMLCVDEDRKTKLFRANLKQVNSENLDDCESRLKIEELMIVADNCAFYVTEKYIYSIEKGRLTRLNKLSLDRVEMSHSLSTTLDICQIVGTDSYVYAARGESMLLLIIDKSNLNLADQVTNDKIKSRFTRCLTPDTQIEASALSYE